VDLLHGDASPHSRRLERHQPARAIGTPHEVAAQPAVLVPIGELDFSVTPVLRELLLATGDAPIIDLSEATFIDAGAIGEFVRLAKRVAPRRPVLLHPQPHVRRIIELLELDAVFAISDERVTGTIPRRVWRSPAL
jgi:anti-anti-sigma factor